MSQPWLRTPPAPRGILRRQRTSTAPLTMSGMEWPTATPSSTSCFSLLPSTSWWLSPTGTALTPVTKRWPASGPPSGLRCPPAGPVSHSTLGHLWHRWSSLTVTSTRGAGGRLSRSRDCKYCPSAPLSPPTACARFYCMFRVDGHFTQFACGWMGQRDGRGSMVSWCRREDQDSQHCHWGILDILSAKDRWQKIIPL